MSSFERVEAERDELVLARLVALEGEESTVSESSVAVAGSVARRQRERVGVSSGGKKARDEGKDSHQLPDLIGGATRWSCLKRHASSRVMINDDGGCHLDFRGLSLAQDRIPHFM